MFNTKSEFLVFIASIAAIIAGIIIGSFGVPPEYKTFTPILIALLILFISTIFIMVSHTRTTINKALDDRLPKTYFINDSSEIKEKSLSIVKSAKKHIFMTGSATRDKSYLDEIEAQVSKGVKYTRILYQRHTREALDRHLEKLIDNPNIDILYADEAHHGYFAINEKAALIMLPGRITDESVALYFSGNKQVNTITDQFHSLSRRSTPITTRNELSKLLQEISKHGN